MLKINLIEPEWWKSIMLELNYIFQNNQLLYKIVPYTADVFVFFYPVYLVVLYLYWVYRIYRYKKASLYIFFSVLFSFLINIFIQLFVDKSRPETFITVKGKLLLQHVPDVSFPSDHAVVSSSIAWSSIYWAILNKDKNIFYIGILLLIFSFIMMISRVAAWVHWVTDVIVGFFIGMIIPAIILWNKIFVVLDKYIFKYLIVLQEYIFKKLKLVK